MEALFLTLVNLSIQTGWLISTVAILRLLLKKAPKWIICLLWGLVGIRLIFPFSLESGFSLIPSAQTIPPDISFHKQPAIHSGLSFINELVNPVLSENFAPQTDASINPLQVLTWILSLLWIVGVCILICYALIRYVTLKYRLKTATLFRDNIRQSELINSPFVLGIFKPTIYLPYHIDNNNMDFIIAHEQAHIRRMDYLTKFIAFLLLSVYWFHPLVWLAYILFCHDIELACDEKVIKAFDTEKRKEYSKVLLRESTKHTAILSCPLAFGEIGIKERIKNVIRYKKPPLWIMTFLILGCVVIAACFLTSPKLPSNAPNSKQNKVAFDAVYPREYLCRTLHESEPNFAYVLLENETDFQFVYSYLSSHILAGTYEIIDDKLILKNQNGDIYTFLYQYDTLIFDKENSSYIPSFRFSADLYPEPAIKDGDKFLLKDANDTSLFEETFSTEK